jgi:signal transduction histidine kinase
VKGFFTKSKNVFSMLVEGEYGTVTPEAKAIIHEALASETKGVAMVQEILNAANLHRGTVSYTASAYNFLSLIRSQIQDIQPAADAKNIKVTITVEGNDSDFAGQADVTNISHVIKNILDNAVRYTPSGSITVHVMHQYGPAGDPHFVCEITDTGVGLDAEDAQRLFTEGGRGHDSVRVNVESTGYGLYIAKKIVNAHGGTITATSAGRGKGSTFRIEVPAQVTFARI